MTMTDPTTDPTTAMAGRNARAVTADEKGMIKQLKELTDEAFETKAAASRIAAERREVILALRKRGWSYRRIGDTIGVSGQRIDSMLRLGDRLAAGKAGDDVE